MSKNRRQSKAAHRNGRGKKPGTHAEQSSGTIDPGTSPEQAAQIRSEATARGWRIWLKEQPSPQKIINDIAPEKHKSARQALADLDGVVDVATSVSENNTEIVSPAPDAVENAIPSSVDVKIECVETRKEIDMQAAKKDDSIIDDRAPTKVDLRDAPPAKVSALKEATASQDDDIASLFGPVIEDDVKGVRNQIRELIQCEMQGELGQRFSRNLRIVIRREIAAAIDDQFDRV